MKYLLVLAVVVVAIWVWRNNRRDERPAAAPKPVKPAVAPPLAMVACRVCGTHLPETEALRGQQGSYCSADHRQRMEGPSS